MPGPKNFTTASKEDAKIEREELPYAINGVDLIAYAPDENQITLFSASFAEDAGRGDTAYAINQFLKNTHDRKSYAHIRSRLDDPEDPFGYDNPIEDIIEWLFEEASARPTEPRSDSTGSRDSTGNSSTGNSRAKGSTRSSSTRVASAT